MHYYNIYAILLGTGKENSEQNRKGLALVELIVVEKEEISRPSQNNTTAMKKNKTE